MGKIKVHPLFIIYIFVCIYFNWFNAIFYYVLTIFLHEYAHFFVINRYGYETKSIIFNLYGVGLQSNTVFKKKHDVIISLAGPILNLILIILIICFWWIIPHSYLFTFEFFKSNLAVMLFNLLPIYPLDGGRVVFALLSDKVTRKKLLKINNFICFIIGLIFILLFLISIFYMINFSLLFIGLFMAINSIVCDKNGYFNTTQSLLKSKDKNYEVKIFKVSNLDKKNLLKYINPHYYSLFICKINGKNVLKSEDDLLI